MFVSWWKWQSGIKGTPPPFPFPCCSESRQCSWKKPWYKKGLDCRLCLSRLASRIHLLIFLYGFISLSPECLLNFLSKIYIPPCLGKSFKLIELIFLENALIRGISTHAPPHSRLTPISCHHALGRRKLLIPPGSILPKIYFPQQQKGVEKTMI